ncbi:MAG TPA: cytochrome P450 [Acidimicrobiales bacterium]|nr:cytochrome P450 [Acidimicrobiales bacterium]
MPRVTDIGTDRTRPGTQLAAGLLDPGLYSTDPHRLFRALRAEAPVAWNEEHGFWAVSRHADVSAIGFDHQAFCAHQGILVEEIGVTYETPPTMMHTDPPAHTRYRRLVQPGFKPTVVRALEPAIRARARALVGGLDAGRTVDVVEELSVPLPLQVISEIMGLPVEDWKRFYEWSEAVIPGATDWPEERRNQLQGEMISFLIELTTARRQTPEDDVLTELARASIDGDRLSDAELAMFLVQLLVAGNETTRNMISGGLVAFADHPGQFERLAADRALVVPAVEEMLRYSTPVVSFMRTATRPTELSGVAIAEGEPVLMLYASANRDEEVFGPTSALFDVGRHPNPHIAFGNGAHFCLGAALARLEGRIVLEELLDRFASVDRAGPVERSGSSVIAGVRRAELQFTAA